MSYASPKGHAYFQTFTLFAVCLPYAFHINGTVFSSAPLQNWNERLHCKHNLEFEIISVELSHMSSDSITKIKRNISTSFCCLFSFQCKWCSSGANSAKRNGLFHSSKRYLLLRIIQCMQWRPQAMGFIFQCIKLQKCKVEDVWCVLQIYFSIRTQ